MANNSESGHAKNVANFDLLINSVVAYGDTYNPAKNSIKLPQLQSLATEARNVLEELNKSLAVYNNAIAARKVAFEPLNKLTTRILNAFKASDSSKQIDETASSLVRKIQGRRATPKKTDEEKAIALEEGKSIKENSSSQMSFDSRLESLDKLIKLLASVSHYAPNETELKVETLIQLHNYLHTIITEVNTTNIAVSNIRIKRNDIFYKEITGLVDIAADTKMYVKSVFGASSLQYKQISKLSIKSIKL